jgi:hypothetical protein
MIRSMVELQIESIDAPLLRSPEAASLALSLVGRAQTMGFLPLREGRVELDQEFFEELAELLRRRGVASRATASLAHALRMDPLNDVELIDSLRATLDAVDASPHPEGEWAPARELLGDELLARLLRISASSLRRYAAADRRTPDEVAWRLHLVARLLAALVGSYNDYGIRRWFERRRSALDGVSPAELLERAEAEDDERLERLLAIAEQLTGAGAAA